MQADWWEITWQKARSRNKRGNFVKEGTSYMALWSLKCIKQWTLFLFNYYIIYIKTWQGKNRKVGFIEHHCLMMGIPLIKRNSWVFPNMGKLAPHWKLLHTILCWRPRGDDSNIISMRGEGYSPQLLFPHSAVEVLQLVSLRPHLDLSSRTKALRTACPGW